MLFSKKAVTTCAVSCLLSMPLVGVAEEVAPSSGISMANKWQFNGSVENLSFDEAVADQEFVDSSALAFNFDAEYFFTGNFSGAAGFGIISYDDNNSFSQETESVYGGDVDTSDSSATGIPFYFDAGYTHFWNSELPTFVTLRGGYATMLESERSISNCSDCYAEDIEIDGGAYAMAGVGVNLARIFSMGLYYKAYLSGDMENAVGLRFSFGNFRAE